MMERLAPEAGCGMHAHNMPSPAGSFLRLTAGAPRAARQASCSRCKAAANDTLQEDRGLRKLRRGVEVSLVGAFAAAQLFLSGPSLAREPFLTSTGARGVLAQEEERLLKLREEIETEARQELDRARVELEAEGRESMSGKLCATPFGVDVVGITEFVALTGALVGGFSARQRKDEVERLNEQLRKINLSLRQQARVGTVYAPGLTYAPAPTLDRLRTTTTPKAPSLPLQEQGMEVSAATAAAAVASGPSTASMMASMDEEDLGVEKKQCLNTLRDGKRLLKQQHGASAMVRFEKALMLAKSLGERVYERRATRGLAASARLQGQQQTAIEHLKRVLDISKEIGDHVGDADAYGTIADIYTDMGQFEKAAEYYDRYIAQMSQDGPV